MTQGRGDGESWVTAFMLSYSLDAYDWQYVDDHYGNQRVCITNTLSHHTRRAATAQTCLRTGTTRLKECFKFDLL